MPLSALLPVVVAACTHATWNLFAKRAADSRHFVWLYSAISVLFWLPLVAATLLGSVPFLGRAPPLDGLIALALLGTGVLHLAYSLGLQKAYSVGDLSVVYPTVRGTGPLLSFVGAIVLLGERPTVVATAGAASVVGGVFLIAGGGAGGDRFQGLRWGFATGGLVAGYTLWDGWAVKAVGVLPLLLDYSANFFRLVVMGPRTWGERATLRAEIRRYWREALVVAVLGPLGYILVLTAMQIAPISRVAPARELSMLLGAMFGARFLKEGNVGRRLLAAGLIATGVAALALG